MGAIVCSFRLYSLRYVWENIYSVKLHIKQSTMLSLNQTFVPGLWKMKYVWNWGASRVMAMYIHWGILSNILVVLLTNHYQNQMLINSWSTLEQKMNGIRAGRKRERETKKTDEIFVMNMNKFTTATMTTNDSLANESHRIYSKHP